MIRELLESNNLSKQMVLTTKLIYQNLIDEIYKQVRDDFSKKDIVSILNKGEDEKLDVDVNELFSKLIDEEAKKIAKRLANFDEDEIIEAARTAKKEVKDPIKKEILIELIDRIL